ncbi:MAG: hypothetical protein JXR48_03410 [Candidatus Delongbacteria bacterium]|nr:hypothetical protein [Candidatus Delongbacteria bacterium]MBN2833995.1 hypothetical protein [Candidatus Delongbacteria bacterium]
MKLVITFFLLFCLNILKADYGVSGADEALSFGGVNPANLGYVGSNNFTIQLPSVKIYNSFLLKYYDRFALNKENLLSKSELDDMIDMAEYGWRWKENYNINLFTFNNDIFKISLYTNSLADLNLPVDLLKIARGYDYNEQYKFDDYGLEICHYVGLDYSQSFNLDNFFSVSSIGLDDAYAGFTIKGLYSPRYYRAEGISGVISVNDIENGSTIDLDAVVEVFDSFGGIGGGFDFGISGFINDNLSIGVSLNNIATFIIFFQDNNLDRFGLVTHDYLDFSEFDNDSIITATEIDENIKEESRTIFLPMELNASFGYNYDSYIGDLLLLANYRQGFEDRLMVSTTPEISGGAYYTPEKLDWLTIKCGFSAGGNDRFRLSNGVSFYMGFYSIDFSIMHQPFGEDYKLTYISFANSLYF